MLFANINAADNIDDNEKNGSLTASKSKNIKLDNKSNDVFLKSFMFPLKYVRTGQRALIMPNTLHQQMKIPLTGCLNPVEIEQTPIALQVPKAKEIKDELEKFIAGQSEAITSLSQLAHRFMCNKLLVDRNLEPASKPQHCILTGPTGCGKSETLKHLGIFLKIPVLHINARQLTDEGFKGTNISELIANFCDENNNPKVAIVALDELDKLAKKKHDNDIKNFGLAIQQVLLSCLDGNPVAKGSKRFDVKNWWFISTGAFSEDKGLHDDKGERSTTAITYEDIINYGIKEELAARIKAIIPFKGHNIDTMMDVISREDSPTNQVQKEFKLFYNIRLKFEEQALRKLAGAAIKIDLGVRSLDSILNMALTPLYEKAGDDIHESEITVTLNDILPALNEFERRNKKFDRNPPPFGMYS